MSKVAKVITLFLVFAVIVFSVVFGVVAAKKISKMKVGDRLHFKGHFSSRAYKKPVGDIFELRLAYEVNIDEILE